jgi:hypothetical protein
MANKQHNFVFDDSGLGRASAQKILDESLRGADDGELFFERGSSESPSSCISANIFNCNLT